MPSSPIIETPDKRYIVVRGRLWRASNPDLPSEVRAEYVASLMHARRAVGVAQRAGNSVGLRTARSQVDDAKRLLGERGPVWWTDGAPDLNRHGVHTTCYATWYAARMKAANPAIASSCNPTHG